MIKYKIKEIKLYDDLRKKYISQNIIVKYDLSNPDFIIPSPISFFIIKYGKENNSQKKLGDTVCPFLNFIFEQVYKNDSDLFISLKYQGLSGLTFKHLASYLNYKSNNFENPIMYSTVKHIEYDLIKFYQYLSDLRINTLNDEVLNRVQEYNLKLTGKRNKKASPFDFCPEISVVYPPNNSIKKNVLKDMNSDLWFLMIEYAEENYRPIAFGVLLMICGGIRQGECVNLLVKDVKYTSNKERLFLNIQDRQLDLFAERDINLNSSQVKKQRKKQPILELHPRILEIFENHKAFLYKKYGTENIANDALFVDANGQAMSGKSFREYFYRLKKDFIKLLEDEGLVILANDLNAFKWGTHIGRHIFTNAIVKNGYANGTGNKPIPKIVALLRGDASEESSMVYIDELTLSEGVAKNINEISKIAKEYKNE